MLAAALGGLDAFVFTAGLGENSDGIRVWISEKLAWLGAELDTKAWPKASHLAPGEPRKAVCDSDR